MSARRRFLAKSVGALFVGSISPLSIVKTDENAVAYRITCFFPHEMSKEEFWEHSAPWRKMNSIQTSLDEFILSGKILSNDLLFSSKKLVWNIRFRSEADFLEFDNKNNMQNNYNHDLRIQMGYRIAVERLFQSETLSLRTEA